MIKKWKSSGFNISGFYRGALELFQKTAWTMQTAVDRTDTSSNKQTYILCMGESMKCIPENVYLGFLFMFYNPSTTWGHIWYTVLIRFFSHLLKITFWNNKKKGRRTKQQHYLSSSWTNTSNICCIIIIISAVWVQSPACYYFKMPKTDFVIRISLLVAQNKCFDPLQTPLFNLSANTWIELKTEKKQKTKSPIRTAWLPPNLSRR